MSIKNPSKSQIEEALAKIGWYLRHHGCEYWFFYNHKKKCTGLYLLFPETDARLGFDGKNHRTPSFTFYLKHTVMEEFESGGGNSQIDCVSFRGERDDSIFILCQNFDAKRKK